MNTTEKIKLRTEEDFRDRYAPDVDLAKEGFSASVTDSGVTVWLPLGIDYHFLRGISVELGFAKAVGEVTIEVSHNIGSRYRLGQVLFGDIAEVETRKVLIPWDSVTVSDQNAVQHKFRRSHPRRILVRRNYNLVMSFEV